MSQKRRIFRFILAYLLWIVSTGIGIIVLNLIRETILLSLVVVSAAGEPSKSEQFYQGYRIAAATHWSILIIGLLILIMLVGLEHYYRDSIGKGLLYKRFFWTTGFQMAALFIAHAIYFILERTFIPVGWWGIGIPAFELLAAALFFILSAIVQVKPLVEE